MKKGFKQLVQAANEQVKAYTVEEAQGMLGRDDVVFVDVRDAPELAKSGKVPGAVHASRGMLEFNIDPESPYHNPAFAEQKQFVFYCASGGRSALAAQRAQEMGLDPVAHVAGGFTGWVEAGGPTESM